MAACSGPTTARHPCDLLAVDLAYPAPLVDDTLRTAAHQAWTHGQVLLLDRDGRTTLAVPGTSFTADEVLDAITRAGQGGRCAPVVVLGAAEARRLSSLGLVLRWTVAAAQAHQSNEDH